MVGESPKPQDISKLRAEAGMTMKEIGALVHVGVRTWQRWESGDREMHPAFWELLHAQLGLVSPYAPTHNP